GLMAEFREALAGPHVSAIVFAVDSPGGSADLIPEAADEIRRSRGAKPIVAVASTLMASAAYWLAASADEIVASPSAFVGSIGVFTTHINISKLNERIGVEPTYIFAGKYKVEGRPDAPLDDAARQHVQTLVDDMYGQFVAAVAKGRVVSEAQVRGATY